MDDDASGTDQPTVTSRFEYDPGVIRSGVGCVDELGDELERHALERALVVCGSTVGSTPAVIEPVTGGLGDRLVDVFAETTPNKRLGTAVDAVDAVETANADVLVSLGGGSSLDTAKAVSVLASSERAPGDVGRELAADGTITVPDGDLLPIVAIPTTLAGADLSQVAGITASPANGLVDEPVSGGLTDPRLMPVAVFYDPALVATTPTTVLAGSAMNGFDKGLETLYAPNRTPVTDATAVRGLSLLQAGLPAIVGDSSDSSDPTDAPAETTMARVIDGILLVQYGISRPDGTTLSIIHAFGHGLRDHGDVQQGIAHAIVAPHVLAYLFEHVDARRDLLADALGVPRDGRSDAAVADGIVDAVAIVRDDLGLPSELRSIDGLERSAVPDVAQTILEDGCMENLPPGFAPTADGIETVLERAW